MGEITRSGKFQDGADQAWLSEGIITPVPRIPTSLPATSLGGGAYPTYERPTLVPPDGSLLPPVPGRMLIVSPNIISTRRLDK